MKEILQKAASALLVLLTFLLASTAISVHASGLPYTDVPQDADYFQDLLKLYQRGIVSDTPDHRFNPDSLMNRDDFVAIIVGVSCKKCLIPSFDDILKYTAVPFTDFKRENPTFYCVSYAKEQGIVEGYVTQQGGQYTCQNGQTYTETPFCAENKITRIEAAAVLLRQAGFWDNTRNTAPFQKTMTLTDVSESWYGYAQKAIQVGIVSVDQAGKIRPDEFITKREFVRMAAHIFRINLCSVRPAGSDGWIQVIDGAGTSGGTSEGVGSGNPGTGGTASSAGGSTQPSAQAVSKIESTISAEIRVLDSENQCSKSTPLSRFPNPTDRTYTFFGLTDTVGWPYEYSWEFARVSDGKRLSASGSCLKDFDLTGPGTWLVRLTIRDTLSGAQAQAMTTVEVRDPADTSSKMTLAIHADLLVAPTPSTIHYTSILSGWTAPFEYRWDLSDWGFSSTLHPDHAYDISGPKLVVLTVRDSRWNIATAELVVVLEESDDWDKDGVLNLQDSCPMIYWPKTNRGCPMVETYNGNTPAPTVTNAYLPGLSIGVVAANGQCRYEASRGSGAIFGTPSCGSMCPCKYEADYVATLRSCDVVFPAIMSPDRSEIYSRGRVYEVRF